MTHNDDRVCQTIVQSRWLGEWVEVKTLTIGEVTHNARGEVSLEQLSSFSRLL